MSKISIKWYIQQLQVSYMKKLTFNRLGAPDAFNKPATAIGSVPDKIAILKYRQARFTQKDKCGNIQITEM